MDQPPFHGLHHIVQERGGSVLSFGKISVFSRRFFSAWDSRRWEARAQELSENIIRMCRGPLQDNLSEWGLLSKTVLQEAPLPTPPFILKKGGVQALNVPARLAGGPGWDSRAPINGELIYSHTDQSP